MKQIILLSFITFGMILVGLATLNAFLVALSFPFFLYLISGSFIPQPELNLIFERQLSTERTTPGNQVEITIKVTNLGPRVDELLIEDKQYPEIQILKGSPSHLLNLDENESFSWSYNITGQRGFFHFDHIKVETRSALGLSPACHEISTTGSLLILPNVIDLPRVSINPHWTRFYTGEISSRSGGLGTDFFGVRQYQSGDPPNWINWHVSARHPSNLYSNEFEQEKVSDVGIILDGRERVNTISSNTSIFEYSVQAAASIAAAFIKQGDRVSLLEYGKYLQWIIPGYGKYQLEKILRTLSTAQPGRSLVFSYLEYIPTQIFPPKSQVVLISPLAPEDPDVLLQIRARGYQVLVICPDPISFEQSVLPDKSNVNIAARILNLERKMQINRLLQGGIQVLEWNVSQPFEQVINTLHHIPVMAQSRGMNL